MRSFGVDLDDDLLGDTTATATFMRLHLAPAMFLLLSSDLSRPLFVSLEIPVSENASVTEMVGTFCKHLALFAAAITIGIGRELLCVLYIV